MEYSILTSAPLFRGINRAEIEKILNETPHRVRKFNAGALISQRGDQVTSLLIVTKGTVKGEMVDDSGRVIKIEDIQAPGALAAAFIFGNMNRFPVNVVATSDVEILSIRKPDFFLLLKFNDGLLVNFLNMISNRSQFLSEKIKFLNFKSVKGKLAHLIIQKTENDKTSLILDMTQNDIADLFGVARPSVARAMGELEKDGFIEATGKNIRILNKKGLSDFISD